MVFGDGAVSSAAGSGGDARSFVHAFPAASRAASVVATGQRRFVRLADAIRYMCREITTVEEVAASTTAASTAAATGDGDERNGVVIIAVTPSVTGDGALCVLPGVGKSPDRISLVAMRVRPSAVLRDFAYSTAMTDTLSGVHPALIVDAFPGIVRLRIEKPQHTAAEVTRLLKGLPRLTHLTLRCSLPENPASTDGERVELPPTLVSFRVVEGASAKHYGDHDPVDQRPRMTIDLARASALTDLVMCDSTLARLANSAANPKMGSSSSSSSSSSPLPSPPPLATLTIDRDAFVDHGLMSGPRMRPLWRLLDGLGNGYGGYGGGGGGPRMPSTLELLCLKRVTLSRHFVSGARSMHPPTQTPADLCVLPQVTRLDLEDCDVQAEALIDLLACVPNLTALRVQMRPDPRDWAVDAAGNTQLHLESLIEAVQASAAGRAGRLRFVQLPLASTAATHMQAFSPPLAALTASEAAQRVLPALPTLHGLPVPMSPPPPPPALSLSSSSSSSPSSPSSPKRSGPQPPSSLLPAMSQLPDDFGGDKRPRCRCTSRCDNCQCVKARMPCGQRCRSSGYNHSCTNRLPNPPQPTNTCTHVRDALYPQRQLFLGWRRAKYVERRPAIDTIVVMPDDHDDDDRGDGGEEMSPAAHLAMNMHDSDTSAMLASWLRGCVSRAWTYRCA